MAQASPNPHLRATSSSRGTYIDGSEQLARAQRELRTPSRRFLLTLTPAAGFSGVCDATGIQTPASLKSRCIDPPPLPPPSPAALALRPPAWTATTMTCFVYGTLMYPEVSSGIYRLCSLIFGTCLPPSCASCAAPPSRLTGPTYPSPHPWQVLSALISRVPRSEPALIRGYQRYAIRGQVCIKLFKA